MSDHKQPDCPLIFISGTNYHPERTRQLLATKRRYTLEKSPSRTRGSAEYNPLYDTFQPITPPSHLNQQLGRPAYEKSFTHYLNNEQRQRNTESSPTSETEYFMDKLSGNKNIANAKDGRNQPQKSMRRHVLNNIFDFLAIAATCLVFGLIYLLVKPVQRGFFCDDTSIQYPFKPDTIPMWLLAIYGGLAPVIIFCIVEIWVVRPFQCGRGPNKNSLKQRQVDYFKSILQTTFLFLLGIAICFLITEVGKRTIGRIRPYYISICNPVWSDIECTKTVTSGSGSVVIPQYIINHTCNSTATPGDLQEARLSFPSGHSSYSTYAFVFLFVYFEARLVCPNLQFFKPFLQCICIAVAFFTCLSRVTDFKHHPTDVIGGAIIGFCISVFAAIRVGTYLWSFSVYCETEEETEKDRLPKEERIPVPGIETRQNGALRSNEQIQLDTLRHYPTTETRPHNTSRSSYENNLFMQQQRTGLHPVSNGTRRIVPEKGYDDLNA